MPFQEKTVIEPKYDVKLVGRIIRYYRKKRKWSVSNFAKTNYVEKSYLSEIELGKKYADLETLANIFKSLGICYDFSNELYHEIRSDFLLYYKAVVYQNNEYANQIFNRNVGNDKRLFSDGFIYVYLIKLIAHVVYDEEQEDICEILNILREFEDVMDEMCLQVYYDYLGVYMARENRTSALNLFELALTKSNREIYKSMIYFHIARVESDQYKFLNAFENLQKAKELFNSELNVRRSIQCEIMIAVIFIRNNYYVKDKIKM